MKNNKLEVMTWHLMQLNQNAVQLKKKPKRKKVFLKDYGVSFLEFGGGKALSKLFGNNKINHFFKSLGADNVKVGMQNIAKSVKNLANASDNYIAAFFGAVTDGVIKWLEKRFATQTA